MWLLKCNVKMTQQAYKEWADSISNPLPYTVEKNEELKYYKILVTNHIVEVYEMDKQPFKQDMSGDGSEWYDERLLARTESVKNEALEQMRDEWLSESIRKVDRKKERRSQTLRDARNLCRRLAIANFDSESLFITLTYAENMQDIKQADLDFKNFIKRFRYEYGAFDYIAVREFQKRGAIHYHMICNPVLEWKNEKELRALEQQFGLVDDFEADIVKKTGKRNSKRLWGFGWVDIQRLNKTKKEGKNVDNVGAYLTKYMTKEYDDSRLHGHKAFLPSRGLSRPIEYKGTILDDNIKYFIDEYKQKKETFTNHYENEYLGKITYKEYNLKRI